MSSSHVRSFRVKQGIGLLVFISLGLSMFGCSPSPGALPTEVENLSLTTGPTFVFTETATVTPIEVTPLPFLTATLSQEILHTSTPTPLPIPPYTHMGMELNGSNFVEQVTRVAEDGAGWVRWNGISWAGIEPQEGTRNWDRASELETYSQAVSDAGMKFVAIVRRTPAWAQAVPGYACGAVLPEKLEAFGKFMYDLVERYSQPPYNVKYWELGNEPDIDPSFSHPDFLFGCWGNKADPYYGGGYYAEMLKVVYPQIKVADPEAQVLVGGLLLDCDPNNPPLLSDGTTKDCSPSRFFEGILLGGGGPFFDGISFHAYDYYWLNANGFANPSWGIGQSPGLPVTYYKASFLRELLSQYGYPDKYLLNTETAILCGRDENEVACQTDEYNQTKANYVVQSFVVAKGEKLHANIWYHYQKGWRFSGLVGQSFEPYLALGAYRFVAQMLDGTISLGQVNEFPNVVGYKFFSPDPPQSKEIWIVWSSDGTPSMITLPNIPIQIYDVYGELITLAQNVEITSAPIYIQLR